MKNLAYSKKTKEDQVFLAIKNEVDEMFLQTKESAYAPNVVWLKALLYFTTLFISFFAILNSSSFLMLFLAYLGFGFSSLLLSFNVAHDACHKALSKKQWINKLLYRIIINIQGAKASFWETRHMKSHHLFPNVPGADADLDDNQLIKYAPTKDKGVWIKYQHIYAPLLYLMYTLHWLFYKDVKFALLKKHANLQMSFDKKEFFRMVLIKIVYLFLLLVLPIYLTKENWYYPIICFFAMHFIISFFLVFTFVLTHYCEGVKQPEVNEDNQIDGSWSEHQIDVSIDFHAHQKWSYWIFGGFNAHQAHHLFPAVSHQHYLWITPIVKKHLANDNLEYKEVTFFGGIASHLRYLKMIANS